jgi:DNA-binding transcriptional regulator YhcF (GntR family)
MPTSKKIRVIGTKQFINAETNEVEDFNVISQEEQDFNFDKFWITQIMFAIDEFGSQKMKLLLYLITNRERANNTVLKTVSEMAKETNINKNTIVTTLKILEKHKIIRRKTGVIFISPEVIFKGGHNKRMNVLIQYRAVSQNEQSEDEVQQPKQLPAPRLNAKDIALKPRKEKEKVIRIKSARAGV